MELTTNFQLLTGLKRAYYGSIFNSERQRKPPVALRFPLRPTLQIICSLPSWRKVFLKRSERRRKGAPLVFMALISLYSWSVDYAPPAAVGGYRWWTFVRVLSKLFLLKERRERIISHLLSIRFTHNATAVFARRALLPLLIAGMVAVQKCWCPPLFFFFQSEMFDVLPPLSRLRWNLLFGFCLFYLFLCPLMCCLCPSAASVPFSWEGMA